MNHTKATNAKSSQTSSTSSVNAAASTSTTASSTPCGCGCGCQDCAAAGACCKLTCFERPKYFCGQLLSDADLTLQETYFREKNKLYHRTLDGFGVVCGLRMTCDCHCKGHITIGDGYAIDCCGNDLVICEPRSFDVIGELRKKKCLIEMPRDPCGEREHHHAHEHRHEPQFLAQREYLRPEEDDCVIRRCYYIGICYAEEPLDFVAPYTTECSPAPGPCQATRIREGVRFEIYDELPVRPNPLTEIEKRIECCFRIFREGQFARGLRQLAPCILEVLCPCDEHEKTDQASDSKELRPIRRPDSLFEELRALFLHQLRTCPDQYNCDLEHEVCKLSPPYTRSGPVAIEEFTKLFELIQKYVFSCVLAEFAFQCPDLPDPCCVLIGAVEIENGRLTRVINYPRWYLLCFANFVEVLVYTLANEAACGRKEDSGQGEGSSRVAGSGDNDHRKHCNEGCCPGFEVDVCEFLKLFVADNRAGEYAALASVKMMRELRRAFIAGLDFMKPHGIAPEVLNKLPFDSAKKLAEELNFSLESLGEPPAEARDPIGAILSNLIHRGSAPMAAFHESQPDRLTAASRIMDAPARAVGILDLEARVRQMESEIESLKRQDGKRGGKTREQH